MKMKYFIDLTTSIGQSQFRTGFFSGAGDPQAIQDLIDADFTLKEACETQAVHYAEHAQYPTDAYDAYWDVELAAEMFKGMFTEYQEA